MKISCLSRCAVGKVITTLLAVATLLVAGCKSSQSGIPPVPPVSADASTVRINPGDLIQIEFPGATANNRSERVRLDGMLFLPLIGEIPAAGKTPKDLQADLAKAYAPILQNTEVVVILASTSASIFVSGAVARPGRITMERPMTVLDAIMEAGGFDPKRANVKKVAVIRQKNGRYERSTMNLKPVLSGKDVKPYNLQPFDIIFVPEKLF